MPYSDKMRWKTVKINKTVFKGKNLVHCKKSHVGMRQIPMLTTVAQNQTTWE